jgi:Serpin (serine protease inhibitor)/Acyltransferase family
VSGRALSGLFVGLSKTLRPEYLALSRTVGAEAQTVDFGDDGAETVNRWGAAMTGDVFKQVLPPRAVNENTALVVVSALRLEATWRTPFPSDMTRARPFRVPGAPPVLVPMMFTSAHRRFKLTEHYAVASLPFKEASLEMIIVVPSAVDGLPALEAALATDGPSSLVEGLSDAEVDLYLPAFDQTNSLKLRRPLEGLGARAVFGPSAQLSGIAGRDDLYLAEAFHDVSLSVDELGARATAVTAMDLLTFGIEPMLPAVISADHPFLYFVRELPSGLIVFEGRVVKPKSKHVPVPEAEAPPPTAPSRPFDVDPLLRSAVRVIGLGGAVEVSQARCKVSPRRAGLWGMPSVLAPSSSTRLRGLDTLRALAIALVFAFHYQVFISQESTFGWFGDLGWVGVDLFFVLSGYLIVNQLFDPTVHVGRFYLRRALRTLPSYL